MASYLQCEREQNLKSEFLILQITLRSANVGDTMIIGLCKGLISLRIKVKYVSSHVTPTFLFTIAMFILLVALHGKGMW